MLQFHYRDGVDYIICGQCDVEVDRDIWNTRADNTQRYKEADERVKSLLETLKSTNETSQIIAMRAKRDKEALEEAVEFWEDIPENEDGSNKFDKLPLFIGTKWLKKAKNALKNNP